MQLHLNPPVLIKVSNHKNCIIAKTTTQVSQKDESNLHQINWHDDSKSNAFNQLKAEHPVVEEAQLVPERNEIKRRSSLRVNGKSNLCSFPRTTLTRESTHPSTSLSQPLGFWQVSVDSSACILIRAQLITDQGNRPIL